MASETLNIVTKKHMCHSLVTLKFGKNNETVVFWLPSLRAQPFRIQLPNIPFFGSKTNIRVHIRIHKGRIQLRLSKRLGNVENVGCED